MKKSFFPKSSFHFVLDDASMVVTTEGVFLVGDWVMVLQPKLTGCLVNNPDGIGAVQAPPMFFRAYIETLCNTFAHVTDTDGQPFRVPFRQLRYCHRKAVA